MARPKKSVKYVAEQHELIQKLYNTLTLDDQQSITLSDLDNDEATQQRIMNMLPEIKMYFSTRNVTTLTQPDKADRPWLSVIKHILKYEYEIFPTVTRAGSTCTMRYFFRKRDEKTT